MRLQSIEQPPSSLAWIGLDWIGLDLSSLLAFQRAVLLTPAQGLRYEPAGCPALFAGRSEFHPLIRSDTSTALPVGPGDGQKVERAPTAQPDGDSNTRFLPLIHPLLVTQLIH